MSRKIHIRVKIPFKNPYVVMVTHEDAEFHTNGGHTSPSFNKIKKQSYKLIKGTWGFAQAELEQIANPNAPSHTFVGWYGSHIGLRSYWCFKDEIDALQFRLMVGNDAKQVFMWPDRFFTVHEYLEDNEVSP